jgi:hypothetical protein
MAHYAFLDENNIVIDVIVGVDETELIEGLDPEDWYANFRGQVCKRTSYNGNYRKNYAGIGYAYNQELDAFVPPKPFESWKLNQVTVNWEPPIAYPEDGLNYDWDETNVKWSPIQLDFPL